MLIKGNQQHVEADRYGKRVKNYPQFQRLAAEWAMTPFTEMGDVEKRQLQPPSLEWEVVQLVPFVLQKA